MHRVTPKSILEIILAHGIILVQQHDNASPGIYLERKLSHLPIEYPRLSFDLVISLLSSRKISILIFFSNFLSFSYLFCQFIWRNQSIQTTQTCRSVVSEIQNFSLVNIISHVTSTQYFTAFSTCWAQKIFRF